MVKYKARTCHHAYVHSVSARYSKKCATQIVQHKGTYTFLPASKPVEKDVALATECD